jgi:predicted dehydrogenase
LSPPFGYVILGCGPAGTKRAKAVLAAGGRVVAVFDPDHDRATALAAELPGSVRVPSSAGRACASDDAEIAIVATPTDQLAPLGHTALDAGCHVLLEKPGARCADELDRLAREARQRDRVIHVGYNHRFHPAMIAVKELVDSRQYGDVLWVRGHYGHGGRLGYEHEWRTDPSAAGGGELLDQGVHLLDLARLLIGEATLAFAELRTGFWPIAVEDNAYVALRSATAFAWLHASWTEWKNEFALDICLRSARLDVRGLGGSYGTERLVVHEMLPELGPPLTAERSWTEPDRSWQRELEAFELAIANQPSPGCGIDEATAILRLVDSAYGR